MTRHKKFLKAEKARTKLKGAKLPKGLNVTKTEFKVRKIIIPEQIRARGADEVLSKSRLNIKDCFTRLQHNNTGHRVEGLKGLRDIIEANFEVINTGQHMAKVIGAIAALSVDIERDVRLEAFRALNLLVAKAGQSEIEPFFDLLCSYLRCTMTHIQPTIQEDSFLLLDLLINHLPSLVASSSDKIFSSFLDMISKLRSDGQPQRTLKVRLAGKLTSSKWRTRVLDKLFALFMAVIRAKRGFLTSNSVKEVKMVQEASVEEIFALEKAEERFMEVNYFDEEKPYFYALNFDDGKLPDFSDLIGLNLTSAQKTPEETSKTRTYIETIVPLLFESWVEVRPENNDSLGERGLFLSTEAAFALKQVLRIFIAFLSLIDLETSRDEMLAWFRDLATEDFLEYLLPGFPFLQMSSARVKSSDAKEFERAGGSKCVFQNLSICRIYFVLSGGGNLDATSSKMLDYVRECVENLGDVRENSNLLFSVLNFVFLQTNFSWVCSKTRELLKTLIQVYLEKKTRPEFRSRILLLLCEVLMNSELHRRYGNDVFSAWIRTLPTLLSRPSVPFEVVQALILLSRRSNKVFLGGLADVVPQIFEALPEIQVVNAPNDFEGRKAIASLVYWVTDQEKLRQIRELAEGLPADLRGFVGEIVERKLNK